MTADPNSELLKVVQHVLERRKIETTVPVTAHVYEVPYLFEQAIEARLIAFEADILSDRVAESQHTEVVAHTWDKPTSTWQFFKERHARSWWLRWLVERRPVRYETIRKATAVTLHADRWRMFPNAQVSMPPRLGGPVVWESIERVERREAP